MTNDRYIKKVKNNESIIHDTYNDITYNLNDAAFLKKVNEDWKSRQYHKKKRYEAERIRDMAITVIEGYLTLEKLREEWYINEPDENI